MSFRRLLLLILAGLLIAEGVGQLYYARKHAAKRQEAEAVSFLHSSREFVEYKNKEYRVAKDPGTYRILVLGGSAAAGFGGQYEKSWAPILEQLLNEAPPSPGKRFEIINLAQGSNTSVDDYVNYVKEGARLDPDLVLVYAGWNDIQAFSGNPGWMVNNTESRLSEINRDMSAHNHAVYLKNRFFLAKKYFQIREEIEAGVSWLYSVVVAWRNQAMHALIERPELPAARIARALERRRPGGAELDSLTFEQVLKDREISSSFLETFPRFKQEIGDLYRTFYRKNLALLADQLRADGVRAVFVFQSDLAYRPGGKPMTDAERERVRRLLGGHAGKWTEIVQAYYPDGIAMMHDVASRRQIPFLDMNQVLSRYPPLEIYHDNVHYSEEGNTVIARELYQFLKVTGT